MLAILKDAAARPKLFFWFGPIANHEIDSWLKRSNLRVPDDVRELWAVTGGGDFFESETIFRPTEVLSSEPYFIDDFVDSVNQYSKTSGMPRDYLVFHKGSFLSAIRLSDQKIVTLDDARGVAGVFLDLDDWYLKTLRGLYADRYDLPTGQSPSVLINAVIAEVGPSTYVVESRCDAVVQARSEKKVSTVHEQEFSILQAAPA